jgi:hypothetical protein
VTLAEREAFAASVACLEEASASASPAIPVGVGRVPAQESTTKDEAVAAAGAAALEERPSPALADAVTAPGTTEGGATSKAHVAVPSGAGRGDEAAYQAAPDRAAMQRQAICRALVARGYLLLTRRRMPPPIRKKKVT